MPAAKKTPKPGDSAAKALAASPPPPEDRIEVDVLPAILVNVYVHPDHVDDETPKVDWPQFVAVPPMLGDEVVSLDGTTVGEIIARQHSMDPNCGPLLSLAVKIKDGE